MDFMSSWLDGLLIPSNKAAAAAAAAAAASQPQPRDWQDDADDSDEAHASTTATAPTNAQGDNGGNLGLQVLAHNRNSGNSTGGGGMGAEPLPLSPPFAGAAAAAAAVAFHSRRRGSDSGSASDAGSGSTPPRFAYNISGVASSAEEAVRHEAIIRAIATSAMAAAARASRASTFTSDDDSRTSSPGCSRRETSALRDDGQQHTDPFSGGSPWLEVNTLRAQLAAAVRLIGEREEVIEQLRGEVAQVKQIYREDLQVLISHRLAASLSPAAGGEC